MPMREVVVDVLSFISLILRVSLPFLLCSGPIKDHLARARRKHKKLFSLPKQIWVAQKEAMDLHIVAKTKMYATELVNGIFY